MELTGKCKEEFDNWYVDLNIPHYYFNTDLNTLPGSMQYGVYIDFFDSFCSLDLVVFKWRNKYSSSVYEIDGYKLTEECIIGKGRGFKTREEARQQAITKANEIVNEKQCKENI